MSNKCGIYPGTFDPFTFGHEEIVEKSLGIVDKLIIAIALSSSKNSYFSAPERKKIIEEEVQKYNKEKSRIVVEIFEGLLVNFVKAKEASIIIRGLRAISDFEYEFQMSCINSSLAPEIHTIFLPASEGTHFISSRMVKEVARLGGDISKMASTLVKKHLESKMLHL